MPGKGRVVEAVACRVKNGISANYLEPYMRRRDPDCMVIADDIYVMLLVKDFFQTFTKKPVADAARITEVLVCLSCASRADVDAMVARALEAGGAAPNPPQDHGFMYAHGFEDLDGHLWELAYMEPQADEGG